MYNKELKREIELEAVRGGHLNMQELRRLPMQAAVTAMEDEIENQVDEDEFSTKSYNTRLNTRYPVNASILDGSKEIGRVEIQFYKDEDGRGGKLVVTGAIFDGEADEYNIMRRGFKSALEKIPTMTAQVSKQQLNLEEI